MDNCPFCGWYEFRLDESCGDYCYRCWGICGQRFTMREIQRCATCTKWFIKQKLFDRFCEKHKGFHPHTENIVECVECHEHFQGVSGGHQRCVKCKMKLKRRSQCLQK